MEERVVLVDEHDREIGTAEKLAAHQSGERHRAFSVFVFDHDGRLLMQRRASGKYHSGGLWSNTCCGHPHPGEDVAAAARRRLLEEMGFDCPLDFALTLTYRAPVSGTLVEHEYDHVYVGRFDGTPTPRAAEVAEWRWIAVAKLRAAQRRQPDAFTPWLPIILERLPGPGGPAGGRRRRGA